MPMSFVGWQNAVIGLMIFSASFGFIASVLAVCGVCTSPLPKKIYYFHSAGEIFLVCGKIFLFFKSFNGFSVLTEDECPSRTGKYRIIHFKSTALNGRSKTKVLKGVLEYNPCEEETMYMSFSHQRARYMQCESRTELWVENVYLYFENQCKLLTDFFLFLNVSTFLRFRKPCN